MQKANGVRNVAHQTLLSARDVMARTSKKVSYRQALFNARLQKVVNLRKA